MREPLVESTRPLVIVNSPSSLSRFLLASPGGGLRSTGSTASRLTSASAADRCELVVTVTTSSDDVIAVTSAVTSSSSETFRAPAAAVTSRRRRRREYRSSPTASTSPQQTEIRRPVIPIQHKYKHKIIVYFIRQE